jgi:hypothetical protein
MPCLLEALAWGAMVPSFAACGGVLRGHVGDGPDATAMGTDAGSEGDAASVADAAGSPVFNLLSEAGAPPVPDGACGASTDPGAGCGDLTSDPHHCGTCDTDCEGGACVDAACAPMPAGALATGQQSPIAIGVDANNVYWVNGGTAVIGGARPGAVEGYVQGQLMKCAIGGCNNAPTLLASGWSQGSEPSTTLAFDGANVYFVGDVRSVPPGVLYDQVALSCGVDGCNCNATIAGFGGPTSVVVAGGNLFWTSFLTSEIDSEPLGTAPLQPTAIAMHQNGPTGIAADDAAIYWADGDGDIGRCALPDCAGGPTTLWTGAWEGGQQPGTFGIAVDANHIVWTNRQVVTGSIMACAKPDCAGTTVTIASGRSEPAGIASDGTNVYWVEDHVYRCPITGCVGAPTSLAAAGGPTIAIDDTRVYFVGPNWEIMAIAK